MTRRLIIMCAVVAATASSALAFHPGTISLAALSSRGHVSLRGRRQGPAAQHAAGGRRLRAPASCAKQQTGLTRCAPAWLRLV